MSFTSIYDYVVFIFLFNGILYLIVLYSSDMMVYIQNAWRDLRVFFLILLSVCVVNDECM